jgi:hypothetical protein
VSRSSWLGSAYEVHWPTLRRCSNAAAALALDSNSLYGELDCLVPFASACSRESQQ